MALPFSFEDVFETSAGIVTKQQAADSGGLASVVGTALGSFIAPGIGTVIGGTIGNTVSRIISGAAFSKTPRLTWEQQNAIARIAADQVIQNTESTLREKGLTDKGPILVEMLRKYYVPYSKGIDLANRNADSRQAVARIANGDYRGDFNALIWLPLMVELDNVSTDKADAERRVANVFNAVIKPAYTEFAKTYFPKTATGGTEGITTFVPEAEEEEQQAQEQAAQASTAQKGLGLAAIAGTALYFLRR